MRRRTIIPPHEQSAFADHLQQADATGGSLALRPGPAPQPRPVRRDRAGWAPPPRPVARGPAPAAWINPYRGVTVPFVLESIDESEQILPANPRRVYVLIQNLSAASDMWVNFSADAVVGSTVLLIPRGNYELIGGAMGAAFSPFDSVHLIATVAGQRGVIVEGTWRFGF